MANYIESKFSKHSINFAEHICNNYMYYNSLYYELIDMEIYKFTSKEVSTKINIYRAADTAAESAIRLADGRNKEISQIAEMINAVRKVFAGLTEREKLWGLENLIQPQDKKRDLKDKRLRNKILTLICIEMGFPETQARRRIIREEKVLEIPRDLVQNVSVSWVN